MDICDQFGCTCLFVKNTDLSSLVAIFCSMIIKKQIHVFQKCRLSAGNGGVEDEGVGELPGSPGLP